jgi:hypothetical protein
MVLQYTGPMLTVLFCFVFLAVIIRLCFPISGLDSVIGQAMMDKMSLGQAFLQVL